MPRFLPHIPIARVLATMLVVATAAGASVGQALAGTAACGACTQHDAEVGVGDQPGASTAPEAQSCCPHEPPAGPSEPAQKQKERPAKQHCPRGCANCCLSQGRAPVLPVPVVATELSAAVGARLAVPSVLPPSTGVDRSIFHPPRA